MSDTPELTEQQLTVIEMLVAGSTQKAAAEAVGIAPLTITRWRKSAIFLAELNRERRDVFEANRERLRTLASEAIDTLETLLGSDDDRIRLRAALGVLKTCSLAQLSSPSLLVDAEAIEKNWQQQAASEAYHNALNPFGNDSLMNLVNSLK